MTEDLIWFFFKEFAWEREEGNLREGKPRLADWAASGPDLGLAGRVGGRQFCSLPGSSLVCG